MGKRAHYSLDSIENLLHCEADPEEILSALAEQNLKVFGVVQPANVIIPYHTHDEEELLIVLEGRMKFIIEEEPVMVGVGEALTIAPHSIHLAVAVDDSPAKLLIAFKS
jgi:quercetin dioxygenase-like cupin family protein